MLTSERISAVAKPGEYSSASVRPTETESRFCPVGAVSIIPLTDTNQGSFIEVNSLQIDLIRVEAAKSRVSSGDVSRGQIDTLYRE